MKFFSIKEFSKEIGVTEQTLRNWDKSGKLKPHHRTPSGYRMYSEEQVTGYFKCFSQPNDRVLKEQV